MTSFDEIESRATWLRSLGWSEGADGMWAGQVIATKGRYKPMRLEQAFAVTLKRSVVDKQFAVEISNGRVRLASPWRDLVETQSGVPPQPESPRQAHVREREERPDAERRHDDASVFVGPCEHPHVAPGPEITVLHAREGKKSAVMQHGRCRTCGTRVARIRREGVWTTWLVASAA